MLTAARQTHRLITTGKRFLPGELDLRVFLGYPDGAVAGALVMIHSQAIMEILGSGFGRLPMR